MERTKDYSALIFGGAVASIMAVLMLGMWFGIINHSTTYKVTRVYSAYANSVTYHVTCSKTGGFGVTYERLFFADPDKVTGKLDERIAKRQAEDAYANLMVNKCEPYKTKETVVDSSVEK